MGIPILRKTVELKTTFKPTVCGMKVNYLLHSLLFLLLSFCAISCLDDNKELDWSKEKIVVISSEIVPVEIFGGPKYVDGMLIRIDGENRWKAYPVGFIDGFEFEPGYLYVLKVEVIHLANPPMDSLNVRFKLLSLISKTKVGNQS